MAFSFCPFCTSAQNNTIDSLKNALKNAKHDTARLTVLFQLVEAIIDDKVWPEYNEQAYQLAQKLRDDKNDLVRKKAKRGLAEALNNKGLIYNLQNDIPNALDHYSKSLKLLEEMGDKKGIALSSYNIGTIYYTQGHIPEALDHYHKSLKIREEIGDKEGIAYSLNNIGVIYKDQGNLSKALDYCLKGLTIRKEIGDQRGIAISLNNIGLIYKNQGNLEEALSYYQEGLALCNNIGYTAGVAWSHMNIAGIYLTQEKYKLAFSHADSSLIISKKLGRHELIRNAERLLSRVDSVRENYAGAFEHYKQYVLYRDSVSNEENRKASIRSQLKHEYEKKEAVIREQQEKDRVVSEGKARFQKIVIWSVSGGLLLVIIFTFFVFHSLKTTRKQKVIIEGKQKEILDSIFYARRIQRSLLTTEKYIYKSLKQLQKGS